MKLVLYEVSIYDIVSLFYVTASEEVLVYVEVHFFIKHNGFLHISIVEFTLNGEGTQIT